ncbi:hypothetical protein TNCV_1454081 [Trichonephila clavipes]|nr:hypothetical protein TNCV_1454081 [Trichonephila clavipes]
MKILSVEIFVDQVRHGSTMEMWMNSIIHKNEVGVNSLSENVSHRALSSHLNALENATCFPERCVTRIDRPTLYVSSDHNTITSVAVYFHWSDGTRAVVLHA